MIKEVTYERVYSSASIRRVAQFENERLGVVVMVENGDVVAAFAEARAAVEQENQSREQAYEEAERRQREEYAAELQRQRLEREAQKARQQARPTGDEIF